VTTKRAQKKEADMSLALIIASLWALTATLVALAPRRFHWRGAWALIGTGVPLIGWITLQHGPFIGLMCLAAGTSVLRYPAMHLLNKLRGPNDQGQDAAD
jgi:CHASE2 domain-containing sensor protein